MMNSEELNKIAYHKINSKDYIGLFEVLSSESEAFLNGEKRLYAIGIELIRLNQDLYELLGSSKQYEMAFELHNKLIENRNRIFVSLLNENQRELKSLFKRIVGDFSSSEPS